VTRTDDDFGHRRRAELRRPKARRTGSA
jgi:hypothetical protein